MDIIEAMKERRSVRNYDGTRLSDENVKELLMAIDGTYSPFGGSVTIRLKEFELKDGFRPGTYGMITGAVDYFLLGIADDEASALSAGFRFEQVVLRARQLGLGTCWITATFKGTDFERGEKWNYGERLRVVSPVGVPAKQSVKEKIARFALGSKNRKAFDNLFFYKDFSRAIPEDNRFHEALQMMRIAPSSTNSQPWRALVEGNRVHFYYKPKSRISVLDCGIGLCHFYETEKFRGHDGAFARQDNVPVPPDDWRYLVTYND